MLGLWFCQSVSPLVCNAFFLAAKTSQNEAESYILHFYTKVRWSVHPSVCPSIHWSICPSVYPSICLYISTFCDTGRIVVRLSYLLISNRTDLRNGLGFESEIRTFLLVVDGGFDFTLGLQSGNHVLILPSNLEECNEIFYRSELTQRETKWM